MIKFIKSLFKKKFILTDSALEKVDLDESKLGADNFPSSFINLQSGPIFKSEILKKTYKIFQETKLHPAIPLEGQQVFFKQCQDLSEDAVLDRIIDEVVGEYAENIIQTADSEKILLENRNRMLGADEIRKRLIRYAQEIEKEEEFDKHEVI